MAGSPKTRVWPKPVIPRGRFPHVSERSAAAAYCHGTGQPDRIGRQAVEGRRGIRQVEQQLIAAGRQIRRQEERRGNDMVRARPPTPDLRVAGKRGEELLSALGVVQHEFQSARIERRGIAGVAQFQPQREGPARACCKPVPPSPAASGRPSGNCRHPMKSACRVGGNFSGWPFPVRNGMGRALARPCGN